jgi:hypothetical protein
MRLLLQSFFHSRFFLGHLRSGVPFVFFPRSEPENKILTIRVSMRNIGAYLPSI